MLSLLLLRYVKHIMIQFEKFVTSSGTTDDFETYDFNLFTDLVEISAVFTSTGQSISILEVRTSTLMNTSFRKMFGLFEGDRWLLVTDPKVLSIFRRKRSLALTMSNEQVWRH